jgi:hypothetical protein
MKNNPTSHRLGIPVGKTETAINAVAEPVIAKSPTPVDCVKYGIDIAKSKIMNIKDLTLEDYIFLRKNGGFNKQKIRGLYGFRNDSAFYAKLKEIGAYPESEDLKSIGITEKTEFVELGAEAEQIADIPAGSVLEPEPVVDITPALRSSHPLSIITKHICPVCFEEHDVFTDAEACLNKHAWVVGINKTECPCAFNCPAFIYADMSDGRILKYVAFGYEE